MTDHLTHARVAEARARTAATEDERRLYAEIARLWRELAQVNVATEARDLPEPPGQASDTARAGR